MRLPKVYAWRSRLDAAISASEAFSARRRGRRGELSNAEPMVQRREQLASGLHERQYIMLVLPGEPQLTASPRAHAASRDSYLAALGCRDVTDGASGGSAEPQGARSASSRGSVSVCIVYIYPYHGYTGPGAVTGAPRGRRNGLAETLHLQDEVGG